MEPLLPTTKHRRGRRTARQERALADPGPALLSLDTLGTVTSGDRPLVLDIGFGTGETVVAMAQAQPETDILGVDMHTPGIGDLLATIQERQLANVWVVDADARLALEQIPSGRLAGVRTFFPDPWPKKRHHRRRLVTADFADAVAKRTAVGGFWHLATDWAEYADQIDEVVGGHAAWSGGRIPRPIERPQTKYERRGKAADREPVDLYFTRIEMPE